MAENTEKKEVINLKHKTVVAFVLMLVMLIPVTAALYFFGRFYSWQREEEMEQMYLDIVSRVGSYGSAQLQDAVGDFDDHIRKQIDLTLTFLKDDVAKDEYTGPEIFSDGFVVRLDKEQVILPGQISGDSVAIDADRIEEAVLSGKMRTGGIDMEAAGFAEASDEEDANIRGSLSFGQICRDTYYAQITPYNDYSQYEEMYQEDYLSAMEAATEISGGTVLVVSELKGDPVVLDQFGTSFFPEDLPDLKLTMSDIEAQGYGRRRINGKRVHYSCVKMDGEWMGQKNVYFILILPIQNMVSQLIELSAMISLLMIIFYMTTITYSLSEEEYVLKHVLTAEEARRYNPSRIRRKLWNLGVFGTLMILLIAFLTQSVIQMRQQTSHGKRTLQLVSGQRNADLEELSERVQEVRENWYLDYGTRIAFFLKGKPEAQTEEKLKTCSDITGTDFIMLFDHDGNEIMCSDDYDDFTISRGLGADSSDFRRLLLGVSGIVHPVSVDKTTGLERQMIGVTVDLSGEKKDHGALILALMPNVTGMRVAEEMYDESLIMLPRGTVCMEAEKETGMILYSSEPSLEGKTITEVGLSEKSLQNGFMDFCTILDAERFVISYEQGNKIYYYASDIGSLGKETILYGVSAAVLFAVEMIILLFYLLKEYNDKTYELMQEKISARMKGRSRKAPDRSQWKDFLVRIFEWDTRIPEKRARVVFVIGLVIALQLWVLQMLGSRLMNVSEVSLLNYLFNGDWMHGINLFAVYSILVSVAIASVIVIGSEWILKMIAGFVGPKGETVCILLQSLIKCLAIIVVVFMSLSYIGMLKPQVLASMGIGSFALSLGAKDTIADVISGILIVYNETVRVGDLVEYQGITAIVKDVRIQSTQLIVVPDNDIMTVRNQQISSIINKSRTVSAYILKVRISAHTSVERIESLMAEALPEIKKGCPEIIGMPAYLGILALGDEKWPTASSMITIGVSVNCRENDMSKVKVYINREMLLLFEREGIEVH